MANFDRLSQLTEDSTDPHNPLFWETVYWLAKQGVDLAPPEVGLPEAPIGVQILELAREVAIKTPTQLMEVITVEAAG